MLPEVQMLEDQNMAPHLKTTNKQKELCNMRSSIPLSAKSGIAVNHLHHLNTKYPKVVVVTGNYTQVKESKGPND